jgi:HSP20 family protein
MTRFPFDSLSRLQEELDRFFGKPLGTFGLSGANVFPPINAFSDPEGVVVRAEVPGIPADKLSVQVESGHLTISGERPAPDYSKTSVHRRERQFGRFSRTLQLPADVDPDQIHAECRNGVLTVRLGRRAAAKPRQITVQSA